MRGIQRQRVIHLVSISLLVSFAVVTIAHSSLYAESVKRSVAGSLQFSDPSAVEPSRLVTVRPDYGYAARPVRVRLSASELRIARRLNTLALSWNGPEPDLARPVEWHIEASALKSETVDLARTIMESTRQMLAWDGTTTPPLVHVVIGRTQAWIRSKVESLRCFPNLSRTSNEYLMGAAVCNGRVIVMNLTGYLFLQRSGQILTPALETLPEPKLSRTPYLIAERNSTSLAHEWVHVARYPPRGERSGQGEPAWFREGLSVTFAGMAKVRATASQVTYQEFHVLRLRKFADWTSRCSRSISLYRFSTDIGGGCEYFLGAFALELLLSDFGGVAKILRLYDLASSARDWPVAFQAVYGMSIDEFEARADRYISFVRIVARRG